MRKKRRVATVRATCLAVFTAGESTGDGTYTIDIDGAGAAAPFQVRCDMTNGGWTLITALSSADRPDTPTIQTQTSNCTTTTTYCNVAGKAWPAYSNLKHTWTGCPSARAEIPVATYNNDTGACFNTTDSLLMEWDGSGVRSGMKIWNDCGGSCGGQTRFAANYNGGATLWDSQVYVVSTTGLSSSSSGCGVTNYQCASGYDNIWIK